MADISKITLPDGIEYNIKDAAARATTATIPTVPTNVSAFTNDVGYLTLATLPIYDGTVIG